MIRMGRGNRTESSNDFQEPRASEPAYKPYATEAQPASTRAISESDSMARDIKEGRLSGFVGHGTTLTGETDFSAMLRVDGHLVGSVSSETGTLIVGTNGQVDANIMVAAAMINGAVNGDIIATEKLQLGRTAKVIGNIHSPRLVIEEGAVLEGSCSMLKARESQEEAEVAAATQQYEEPQASLYNSSGTELDPAFVVDEDDENTVAEAAAV